MKQVTYKRRGVFLALATLVVQGANAQPEEADKLFAAAKMTSEYWYKTADLIGKLGSEQQWAVFAYKKPVFGKDAACISTGDSWTFTYETDTNHATAENPQKEKLVYLDSSSASYCDKIPMEKYASIDDDLSIQKVRNILDDLRKTAICVTAGTNSKCGTWKKLTVPEVSVKEQFAELPKMQMSGAHVNQVGELEFTFSPLRKSDEILVCFVKLNSDGSEELDVGQRETGPF